MSTPNAGTETTNISVVAARPVRDRGGERGGHVDRRAERRPANALERAELAGGGQAEDGRHVAGHREGVHADRRREVLREVDLPSGTSTVPPPGRVQQRRAGSSGKIRVKNAARGVRRIESSRANDQRRNRRRSELRSVDQGRSAVGQLEVDVLERRPRDVRARARRTRLTAQSTRGLQVHGWAWRCGRRRWPSACCRSAPVGSGSSCRRQRVGSPEGHHGSATPRPARLEGSSGTSDT